MTRESFFPELSTEGARLAESETLEQRQNMRDVLASRGVSQQACDTMNDRTKPASQCQLQLDQLDIDNSARSETRWRISRGHLLDGDECA